ncbi:phage regulatory CII family protein [Chromobacterium haemolyticum]|uniref:phage regulatory CII family protein n=1 Tax=Chromobacterium haemolyticum TaxID=394935 RepID=UPI00307D1D71
MSSRYIHITAAAQTIAKSHHNGIAGLAAAMKTYPKLLANKLNPTLAANQLTLEEAAEITDRTQDPSIADALAALCNRVTVALPDAEITLKELSRECCRLTTECGDVAREISEAEQPDSEWGERVSPAEAKRIEAALWDLVSVTMGMIQRVRG